ncbi:MAG: fumarylacetoacetate hydrolase family protein [Candidatus Hinthialibacter antarcticus]|nr:fumarylacetoacetate hydrolase family protein [Candidatus Hinthialibacter antarcticus]
MKRLVFTVAAILTCIVCNAAFADGVFCRYEFNGVHYGKVEGGWVHQLTAAPWANGTPTGRVVNVKDAKFLHPSEPKKIFGIAGSYREAWVDKTPFKTIRWFLKPPSSAGSPGDEVKLPASLDEVLVETELVIIIGKRVKDASLEEAEKAIFGYSVGNDMVGSVTSFHKINGEPLDQEETLLPPGLKIGDKFATYGPYIHQGVDWNNRLRTLNVFSPDGKTQTYEHNTSNLLFPPAKIVSDLSRVCVLEPGDVIFSGTTKALSAFAGDRVVVSIEGIGELENVITD